MKLKYDKSIHLNAAGVPDVDYYIFEAKRMRAEMISAAFQRSTKWLKEAIRSVVHPQKVCTD